MSQEEISKYIICYIYGLKPDTAKVFVIVHEDHIEANYKNSFQQLIDNKIKFNGQEVIWGAKNGRWRDNPKDSKISYEIEGNSIKISEKHYNGQVTSRTYKTN